MHNWKIRGGLSQLRNSINTAISSMKYIPTQLESIELDKLDKTELDNLKRDIFKYIEVLEYNMNSFINKYNQVNEFNKFNEVIDAEVIENDYK